MCVCVFVFVLVCACVCFCVCLCLCFYYYYYYYYYYYLLLLLGAKLFFSAKAVYDGLLLTMFSNRPWRWYQSGLPTWKHQMHGFGLSSHIINGAEAVHHCSV